MSTSLQRSPFLAAALVMSLLRSAWSQESRWTRAVTVTEMDAVLVSESRSLVDCGWSCSIQYGCQTFCYGQGGHALSSACYTESTSAGSRRYMSPGLLCFSADVVVTAEQPRGCSSHGGYDLFKERCIKAHIEHVGFQQAYNVCASEGAHLYFYKNLSNPIVDFLTSRGYYQGFQSPNYYWVGADDRVNEGDFRWNDGSVLPSESDVWQTGEPNSQGDEDCVNLRVNIARLQDGGCSNPIPFICEIDM